jgi:hypothetical protein
VEDEVLGIKEVIVIQAVIVLLEMNKLGHLVTIFTGLIIRLGLQQIARAVRFGSTAASIIATIATVVASSSNIEVTHATSKFLHFTASWTTQDCQHVPFRFCLDTKFSKDFLHSSGSIGSEPSREKDFIGKHDGQCKVKNNRKNETNETNEAWTSCPAASTAISDFSSIELNRLPAFFSLMADLIDPKQSAGFPWSSDTPSTQHPINY